MTTELMDTKVRVARAEYFFWLATLLAAFLLLRGESVEDTAPFSFKAESFASAEASGAYSAFENLALEAKAVSVYDATFGRTLYAREQDTVLPLASLTKIMTAITALSLVPETTLIPIESVFLSPEGDSGLKTGDKWVLRDLLQFTLIESSNDGAFAIGSAIGSIAAGTDDYAKGRAFFLLGMNEIAKSLGLKHMHFNNETGLDMDDSVSGGYGTAKEMARLMMHALKAHPNIFKETRWSEFLVSSEGSDRTARNTNKSIGQFPLLIASKTGYTDLAGGNLVVAFDAGFGRPILIVVLGSTLEGRFTDAEKLSWAAIRNLAR